ncbi:MAG: cation:proton antiporter, partial [Burkholderiales bacterium]
MTSAIGFLVVGLLMLAMGLLAPAMRRLPLTTAIIYLAVGMVVGPTVLGLFHFNPLKQSAVLEVLTEAAVLISLFAAGVKLPAPVGWARWRSPVLLAFVSMAVTVFLVAAFGYHVLELPLGAAVLLGAILAPTDPVLAGDVQVRHAGDRDRLRFNLTCEAGMNDGSAFPFVMLGLGLLGLHELGGLGLRWVLVDVLWATAGGIGIGVAGGVAIAHLAARLRHADAVSERFDDFIGLGLIGAVYGVAVLVHTWGFLAVFFAAVALRQTELRLAGEDFAHAPAEPAIPQVSVDSLVFKEQLERLSEILLVLLIGGTLFLDSWSWRAVGLAAFLFLVARPLSVMGGLAGTRTPWPMRGMIGWFGVRGIGSLYYLMYAIEHGLPEPLALEFIHLTLIVVTLSILAHGVSVKPLMLRYWRGRRDA